MRPPTEPNGDTEPQPSEDTPSDEAASPSITEDQEVADWVHRQLELLKEGRLDNVEKPALHAVALDKVGNSPVDDNCPTRRTS